jgi:hypothetical protein
MICALTNYNHIGLMPDQTIKHNNAVPEFLLILIPAAFLAVVLATAWKFILGLTLLLTGNSVWQNYQWTKLSQQVNPAFSQLVIERQGEVTPLELSARAKISGVVANRYLNNKAVEFGGVSYQTPNGSQVYSFLTVGTLNRTFAEMATESTLEQKLAELEPALAPENKEVIKFAPAATESVITAPIGLAMPTATAPTALREEPVLAFDIVEPALEPTAPAPTLELKLEAALTEASPTLTVEASTAPLVEKLVEPPVIAETPLEVSTAPVLPEPLVVDKVETMQVLSPPTAEPVRETSPSGEGSNFTQALRNIFNNPPASVPEEPVAAAEPAAVENISQVDLAKRLDVHASTIYKRRSDVSFVEWTRNRDPEGVAWGYSRETKEFYRVG